MSVQTYHAYINQKTEKVVLHTDHLAALAEKESHRKEADGCPTEGAVLRREWRRLTAELKMKISDWMEVCKKNDALTAENAVLREQNTMMAESKKRLREAMGDVEGGLIRLSNDTQDILSDIMGTNQDSAEEEDALRGGR